MDVVGAAIARQPRVALAHLPTPLEPMPSLSARLGGPRLYVKRDDCTGLALGGNKVRKLEFLVGEARARGADTLVTEGGAQSNHCRQTAAAAARCGMRCVLVLSAGEGAAATGNLLLDGILGADVVTVRTSGERPAGVARAVQRLRDAGRRPFVIPTGGSDGVGGVGYVEAFRELDAQARASEIDVGCIVCASGSGGTQGGLVAGAGLAGSGVRIVGVSDGEPKERLAGLVSGVAAASARRLGLAWNPGTVVVEVRDEFAGDGYGVPTREMVEAVRLVAGTEGILLDPVYTGKAMAGLIAMVRGGGFGQDETVVFLHTGGTPALFAYAGVF